MKIWWITSDPCGLFCAAFTVFLLVYAQVTMSIFIMIPWLGLDINFIIFTSLTVLALVAHTRCQFTDPGCVPEYCLPPNLPPHIQFDKISVRPYAPPKMCRNCRTLKTRRTFHCNAVGRCIVNLDHFCVWCNNSIGALNHRWFFQFLFYTAASCVYCAVLLITRFISCNSDPHMCEMTSTGTLFAIITFIESLVFGFFTMMMLYDQVSGVLEEDFRGELQYRSQLQAYHAAMETDAKYFSDPPIQPPQRSTYELFQDVFGGPISFSWFNPFTQPQTVVEYFQGEMARCVRDADRVTEKFVRFADAVQNGEIVLQVDEYEAEDDTTGPPTASELNLDDFNTATAPQQQPQSIEQQQQRSERGPGAKTQKVD